MHSLPRVALAALALAVAGATQAAPIVAVTTSSLILFDSASPGTATFTALSGIGAGEIVEGIDRRPANGEVYLLTRTAGGIGRVYLLDTLTGAATSPTTLAADLADLTAPYTSLGGTRFGVDFNPVPDRLRVVSDTDANMRINVGNGLVTTDGALNPGNPNIVACAYTNNRAGALTTTLYAIDSSTDQLFIQTPPNNGTLVLVGPLGVDIGDRASFDIADQPSDNTAYAMFEVGGTTRFYTISLATGAATLVGALVGNPAVVGMTVDGVPLPPAIFADGFED